VEEKIIIPTRAMCPWLFAWRGKKREKAVLCNDEKWHFFADLAKLIGIDVETLHKRFARWHWSHPEMLKPGRGPGKEKKKVKKGLLVPPGMKGLGSLAATARTRNLGRIGGPGLLERETTR
jgi:hypothetical protein